MPRKFRFSNLPVQKVRKAPFPKKTIPTATQVGHQLLKKRIPGQRLSYKSSPFAPALFTTMKYTDYARVTTSTSGTSTLVISLNDIYDPVASGWSINGQPFYHDQLLSANGPYYRNCVYGAKVKITMTNNSSSSNASCLINWAVDANYTSPVTNVGMAQYSGEPNSCYFPSVGVNGNSTCMRKFKKYFDIAKMFGLDKKQLFTDDRYSGAYNSSPVKLVKLQVVSSNDPVSSSSSSDVGYVIKVVYYVKCYELMPLVPAS